MITPKIKSTTPVVPMIYAYTTPEVARHNGWTKIGYTEQDVITRIEQQTHTADIEYNLEWQGRAVFDDGTEESILTGAISTYHKMFVRWIDQHIGEAKTVMSAFVLERFKTSQTNSIKDSDEVDITLLMPEWYDDTTFPQLCTAVHDYVVNSTLYDFLSMTLTSKDTVTIDKNEASDKAKYQIKKLANAAKPGRISKPFKPF